MIAYMMVDNKNANFAGWKTLVQYPDGFYPAYYNNWGGALSNRKSRNTALTLYANANGIQLWRRQRIFLQDRNALALSHILQMTIGLHRKY
ncbi:Uncharacterised protein [Enterococcus hirae]|nr:Uncharacterised protein [Enterococcus hirae]